MISLRRLIGLECFSFSILAASGNGSLEKKRLSSNLIVASQFPEGPCKRAGEGLFRRVCSERIKGNGFKLRVGLGCFLLLGWWGTGLSCPEKLYMPHPWKCLRPGWLGLWAAWSSGGCPCLPSAVGLELGDLQDPFQPTPFCVSIDKIEQAVTLLAVSQLKLPQQHWEKKAKPDHVWPSLTSPGSLGKKS